MDDLSFEACAEALISQTYTFAKTMPQIPHWYVVRAKWKHAVSFNSVVQFIREHGYTATFGSKTFTYLNVNGMRYWTMGAPVEETIVLNRCFLPETVGGSYDGIAGKYDEIYSDPKYAAENDLVFSYVPVEVGSLLDIGCGTGLALDYIAPSRYVGFDPSHAMLAQLRRKFRLPSTGFDLFTAKMEEFHLPEQFDYVLCLFGVAEYMSAEQVKRIPRYVKPGGTYLVMVQTPDYVPVVHDSGEVRQSYSKHPVDILPGDVIDTGNGYQLIVGERPAIRKRVKRA